MNPVVTSAGKSHFCGCDRGLTARASGLDVGQCRAVESRSYKMSAPMQKS